MNNNNQNTNELHATEAETQNIEGSQTKKDQWQLDIEKKISELKNDKITFITVSGIFLSIFTFISVEIQFLRYICNFEKIVGFTFIFAGLLLGFIFLLDILAKSWITSDDNGLSLNALADNFKKFKEIKFKFPTKVFVAALIFYFIYQGLILVRSKSQNWKCENSENYQNKEIVPNLNQININNSTSSSLLK